MRIFVLISLLAAAATAAVLSEGNYLPPEENLPLAENPVPSEEIAEVKEAADAPVESAVLADDGYRYKIIRKLKYRHRRDVSEVYLPPAEEVSPEYIPPAEVKEAVEVIEEPQESAVLADDGYRYKTVRKLKYRHRRDVSEIAKEYLPPAEEVSLEYIPPAELKEAAEVVEEPQESAVLADDGYRYKTVRKLKYRHRRDVSEIAKEYLPPAEEVSPEYIPPAEVKAAAEVIEEPQESAVLADDGYRYKTVRKLKYRHRRDVSEIAKEYLPPAEEVSPEYIPPAEIKEAAEVIEEPQESAVLADDGYRYKTVRKLKYRHRRDVSEISQQYLPPAEEVSPEYIPPAEVKEAAEVIEEPQESAVLADDGYRYKTVRKLKYRHRRDVSEIAKEYLPPAEEVSPEYIPPAEVKEAVEIVEEPQESAVLADDGYRYKTVRKLKYRHRRDVSEIAKEYLPPAEEVSPEYIPPAEIKEAAEVIEEPQESAVLADDGYRYKTVRKLKYRHRRDVSEISQQYLPPAEEVSPEYIPPAEVKEAAEVIEEPEESAVLADDGYRYKTVRKLKYRHRRDVSEIAKEYLPPAEEVSPEYVSPTEVKEAAEVIEEPQESAVLADDGYRYKTVRKLKYRHRRDVSEIAKEYLPPAEEVSPEYIPPAEVIAEVIEEPKDSGVLADDGYRYKTVRKLKYRHRRDASEITKEYLPPAEEVSPEYIPPAEIKEVPQDSAVLTDNGYRYKTVRKLRFRS